MIALKFWGQVSDGGRLILEDTEGFKTHLLRFAGKPIELILKKPTKDATQEQRGYLFGVVIPAIADYTGYTEDEVYGILKGMFLRRHTKDGREYIMSLSQCNREEVAKFIDQSVNFGFEVGAEIPPSNRVSLE